MDRDRLAGPGHRPRARLAGIAARCGLGRNAPAPRGFDQGSIPGVATWGDVAAPTPSGAVALGCGPRAGGAGA